MDNSMGRQRKILFYSPKQRCCNDMREIKYKFNHEIQNRTAYTKDEFLNFFEEYSDSYYRYSTINTIKKKLNMSEQEAKIQLNDTLKTLKVSVENREYIDIEILNVINKMYNASDVLKILNEYKWVWKNVINK